PCAALTWQGNGLLPSEITSRQRSRIHKELRESRGCDDFSALLARGRTHLNHKIGGFNHGPVMLDHENGVALLRQVRQDLCKPLGVARMQANRGFIQDVQGSREMGAELSGKTDALRLAA